MTYKKFYSLLIGVLAVSLASCTNDLSENNELTQPNKKAKRTLSLSFGGNVDHRSQVSITDGNQWKDGDIFLACNITNYDGVEAFRAFGGGKTSELKGEIACDDNDSIGVFYPFKLSYGQDQKTVHISMQRSSASERGQVIEKDQDGTIETLRFFDYSYGKTKVKASADGKSASGNVQMHKLYTILRLKFRHKNADLKKIKQLRLEDVVEEAKFDAIKGEFKERTMGAITIKTDTLADSFFVAILPDTAFRAKFIATTTDNKTYTYILEKGINIEAAAYQPIKINLEEENPYVPIDNINWGKFNLQYTPGVHKEGWKEGYHLAEQPWIYLYTARCSFPLQEDDLRINLPDGDRNATAFDHFRWGDIKNAHNYNNEMAENFWHAKGEIKGKIEPDGIFGDIATYASKGKWAIPAASDYSSLMNATGEYIAYYEDNSHNIIYGAFFDPSVEKEKKGFILDKNGNKIRKSNFTAAPVGIGFDKMRKLTRSDFNKGIFFPMAGTYEYTGQFDKMGNQGSYWTSTGNTSNDKQAAAFTVYIHTNGQAYPGYLKSAITPKRNMYSIRPVYIGK